MSIWVVIWRMQSDRLLFPACERRINDSGVSRINRIERALFYNRKLDIEVMRLSIHFECLCRIPVEPISNNGMLCNYEI